MTQQSRLPVDPETLPFVRGNIDMKRVGRNLYLLFDGKRIAKRGHPGTPQAGTWIPLKPGYEIYDNADLTEIIIGRPGGLLQVPSQPGSYRTDH